MARADCLTAPTLAAARSQLRNLAEGLDSFAPPDRLRLCAQAMRQGFPIDEIAAITKYDPWFLGEVKALLDVEAEVRAAGLPKDAAGVRRLKSMGFSDKRLATLTGQTEKQVRKARRAFRLMRDGEFQRARHEAPVRIHKE